MLWFIILLLAVIFLPQLLITAAGYLVQKYKFGVSFKELYNYNKEQDALEKNLKEKKRNV